MEVYTLRYTKNDNYQHMYFNGKPQFNAIMDALAAWKIEDRVTAVKISKLVNAPNNSGITQYFGENESLHVEKLSIKDYKHGGNLPSQNFRSPLHG